MLKEINKNTKCWHEEKLNCIQKAFIRKNSICRNNISNFNEEKKFNNLSHFQPNFNDNEYINSKNQSKNEKKSQILDKCHLTEKIKNLNSRMKKLNKNKQHKTKSYINFELFSLKKQQMTKKDRKISSLHIKPSKILCKILNDVSLFKRKNDLQVIETARELRNYNENEEKNLKDFTILRKLSLVEYGIEGRALLKSSNNMKIKKKFNV